MNQTTDNATGAREHGPAGIDHYRYEVHRAERIDEAPGFVRGEFVQDCPDMDAAERLVEDRTRAEPARLFVIDKVGYTRGDRTNVYQSWDDMDVERLVESSAERGFEAGFVHGRERLIEDALAQLPGEGHVAAARVAAVLNAVVDGDRLHMDWTRHPLYRAGCADLQRRLLDLWHEGDGGHRSGAWRERFHAALTAAQADGPSGDGTDYGVGYAAAMDDVAGRLRANLTTGFLTDSVEDDIAFVCGAIDEHELHARKTDAEGGLRYRVLVAEKVAGSHADRTDAVVYAESRTPHAEQGVVRVDDRETGETVWRSTP